jgi:peroxiredoxin Q/BCP
MLTTGDRAPDFAVGETSLHKMLLETSVVVFFFPRAFSVGCTREAQAFRREFENLKRSGCDVLGVSQDSQETNDRFRKELALPFPLVGDPKGAILESYGVRWPILGFAQRVTYVIGPNRRIRFAFRSEFNMGIHASKACAILAEDSSGSTQA